MTLRGRQAECDALGSLLDDALRGKSGVRVIRGEAGIGKSALLNYLRDRADGWFLAGAAGVESEMELAYGNLHQLCEPMLDHLEVLPSPQRNALATVFGLGEGPPPDRFLVGLATLTLFAEIAERQPLLAIVDDAQWLDHASAQILGFVARRLLAERVALLFGVRTGIGDDVLTELPASSLGGLSDTDAHALLLEHVTGPLDVAVCDQIVVESHGNPLALVELPRTWNPTELAGGFGVLDSLPVPGRIEESYARRLNVLPADTRLLVLAAAAEPVGDPALLRSAGRSLGIDMAAVDAATDAGLLTLGVHVEFAHPLVRSAAYHTARTADRHRVHEALARATNAQADPDRRAWHRARATSGPDDEIANELHASAGRAQARGGAAAAAAFLRRSVELTVDPKLRTERALAAAEASLEAGAFTEAVELLAKGAAGTLDDLERARTHLLRARIASASSFGSAAAELMKAGTELEQLDTGLARETYLDAWGAALAAGELADAGTLREVSRAARSAPPPSDEPRPHDVLLEGLAELVTEGLASAAPTLRKAVGAFRDDESVLRWGTMAASAAAAIWDMEGFAAVATRQLQLARDTGALAPLATALQGAGIVATWSGDFRQAASLVAEAEVVTGATGIRISPYGGMLLAAYRGRDAEARALFRAAIENAEVSGEGLGIQYARWATALLSNGLGRSTEALRAAEQASSDTRELFVSDWALVELVEARVRTGDVDGAAEVAERLSGSTGPSGTDWGLAMVARSRALTTQGDAAEASYVEAVDRFRRTPLRPELARAHLLYGEWLRRQGRRIDAREQLRRAYDMAATIGMEAFAKRARRELAATGEKVRKRGPGTRDELTPQEEQIARLARDGLSNPEIGAQLFISARTVEWHLRKVFTKLNISSRRQLRTALPKDRQIA